jgi:hypothetical protein
MAEDTGSGDTRERVSAKRSAGVVALVAAGLAAGALAAGTLATGATADAGDGTTATSTDPGATTTTDPDPGTTTTDTTDTTVTDPATPPEDTTPTDPATTVEAPPETTPEPPADTTPPPADPAPADPAVSTPAPAAEATPPETPPVSEPAAPQDAAPVAPPAAAPEEEPADTSSGGGREQPRTHRGSGEAKKVVAAPSPVPATPAQPALSARLLPTPAQIRFYVHATSTPPLPKLRTIDHPLALRLSTVGADAHVHWALLAAIAKVESRLGDAKGPIAGRRLTTVPAGQAEQLQALAAYLKEHGASRNLSATSTQKALEEYFGSEAKARRVGALAAFYGALGLGRMQHGIGWHGGQLRKRVLHDKRVHIYSGGRADIRGRRVDPRVLITMEYLANASGSVRVSSLVSGHRLFTAAGGVSAHVYGRAVDVSAVGGVRIKHHQGPGSVTERTVRLLLLLPQRMRPRQVVSLMDVDGPTGNRGSFALADHSDRIQIGY